MKNIEDFDRGEIFKTLLQKHYPLCVVSFNNYDSNNRMFEFLIIENNNKHFIKISQDIFMDLTTPENFDLYISDEFKFEIVPANITVTRYGKK